MVYIHHMTFYSALSSIQRFVHILFSSPNLHSPPIHRSNLNLESRDTIDQSSKLPFSRESGEIRLSPSYPHERETIRLSRNDATFGTLRVKFFAISKQIYFYIFILLRFFDHWYNNNILIYCDLDIYLLRKQYVLWTFDIDQVHHRPRSQHNEN